MDFDKRSCPLNDPVISDYVITNNGSRTRKSKHFIEEGNMFPSRKMHSGDYHFFILETIKTTFII